MADDGIEGGAPAPEREQPTDASAGRRRIGLAAIAIMAIHFLAKIGGYVQKRCLSHFLGTSLDADACTGMEKIFQLIFLIPEELLSHSFLPVFVKAQKDEGETSAWRLASIVGTIHALVLVVSSAAAAFWAPSLVGLVLEGFTDDPAKFALTVQLVRVSMIGLFCTSLGSLTYVILNAYKRFVTPALGDVTQKAGIVIGMVVVFSGFRHLGPIGYAIGFIIGGVFKLVTHLIALRPQLHMVRPGLDLKNPRLREMGILMVPLIAGTLVAKIRDGWEQRLASQVSQRIEGTLASLDYARKIVLMPVLVIPYAFSKAVFPFFADWIAQGDRQRLTEAFHAACRIMVFIFLPMTVFFLVLRQELVTLAYKGGKFDAASVLLTSGPFIIYSLGMIAYALETIAIQVFYAYRDTKTPFYLGLLGSGLQIAIAYTAGLALNFGGAGIALGYAASKTIKLCVMWYALRHRLEGFQWRRNLILVLKTTVASAVMAVWLLLAHRYAASHHIDLMRVKLAAAFLVAAGGSGTILFVVTAAVLRTEELQQVADKVASRLRKRRK